VKKIEERFKKLTDIEHCLIRPSMYIGSIKNTNSIKWIFDDKSVTQKEVEFNPGLLKLFDEIIVNSIDESKRKGSKLDTIKVTVNLDDNSINVWDGGGIPVVRHKEHKEWVPEMIFSNLKSGSNFDDEESRSWSGTNGVGSVLTNIFSKEFIVKTSDGKNEFTQTFSQNMTKRTTPKVKASTKGFTEIKFIPDLVRFGLDRITEDNFLMIQKRVYDLAGCNPNLKIYFNNKLISFKSFKDYVEYYKSDYYFEESKDKMWSISVSHSDNGFSQVSFVNSTETYDGGTHVDYILNQITTKVRDFIQKKHKVDIKPSEIKNHIFLHLNSTIINPSFSSQTKEKLITEPKFFGSEYQVSDKMISWILKSEILKSILDWIEQKKQADESKLQRQLNKSVSNVKVEKLIDAKSKERWKCSLLVFEGDSASNGFRKYRDSQTQGAFSLRGKFINSSDITIQKLIQNQEVVNLMSAIGLKVGQKATLKTLRYGRICIYTDSDYDGTSIVGLLINFFYKFWPELFENKIIFKAETPIVVSTNVKTKKKISFYTQSEYDNWIKKANPKEWDIRYKKGLGALVDDEYNDIINNPRLTLIKKDGLSTEKLEVWFGKSSDLRKKELTT
jgi:DNA topoisomerase II